MYQPSSNLLFKSQLYYHTMKHYLVIKSTNTTIDWVSRTLCQVKQTNKTRTSKLLAADWFNLHNILFACFSFSFFNFYFYFILLYNTVLVLPYIDMNPPQVNMSSQSWTPLPPPTPYRLSGSSPCTSPKHPVSCIEHRLTICFLPDSIHVSMPFCQIIPPLPSPTESKRLLYICVSFAVLHTGLLLPSF